MSIRAIAIAALFYCLPSAMAATESSEPVEPAVPFAEGQTEQAESNLRIGKLFRTGMEAIAAAERTTEPESREARLDEAIAAFHAILVRRPNLVRVHLEIARAFFLKGEDGLARRHFELVLAGKPPEPVVANIHRFLNAIRARRRWQAWFGLGIAQDSNLNIASENRTIWLDTPFGRFPFLRSEEATPKSGYGLDIWGGGEYEYPLRERLRVRLGANFSAREHRGSNFDRHFASVHLGPQWLVDGRTEISLLGTAQRNWTLGQPETDQIGFRVEAERRLTPRLALFGRGGLRRRNCRDCDWLDGPVGEVSLNAAWVAMPILRLGGGAGYSWSGAEDESRRSDGPRASLTANVALPLGFTVGARASMHWTDFEGSGANYFTLDRLPREDRLRVLSTSIFNRAFTLYDFSPRITIINERRDTNAQGLDYSRTRGELSFVKQF